MKRMEQKKMRNIKVTYIIPASAVQDAPISQYPHEDNENMIYILRWSADDVSGYKQSKIDSHKKVHFTRVITHHNLSKERSFRLDNSRYYDSYFIDLSI